MLIDFMVIGGVLQRDGNQPKPMQSDTVTPGTAFFGGIAQVLAAKALRWAIIYLPDQKVYNTERIAERGMPRVMPEIEPAKLLIDLENPRIPNQPKSQREALRAIAADQKDKLLVLARSILSDGLNPTELPVVMPAENDSARFIVLEGNRRLTAIRAMETPNLITDAVPPEVLQGFHKLSTKYEHQPIAVVECVLVTNREDALRFREEKCSDEARGKPYKNCLTEELLSPALRDDAP